MEAEVEERKAEVDNLQNQLSETEKSAAFVSSSATGAAFVSPPNENSAEAKEGSLVNGGSNEAVAGSDENGEGNDGTVDDPNIIPAISKEEFEEEASIEDAIATDSTGEESDSPVLPATGDHDAATAQEETPLHGKSEIEGRGKDGADDKEEDLTLNGMTIEILKGVFRQAESDVKRIAELMAPILQSMMRAGDVAWRHVRALIVSLQKQYNDASGSNDVEDSADAVAA
jgi:hypothetical protein